MLQLIQNSQKLHVSFKDSVGLSEDCLKVTLEGLLSKISEILPLAV